VIFKLYLPFSNKTKKKHGCLVVNIAFDLGKNPIMNLPFGDG
jgi:hypothetical protein